jgi:hypothetical protein
MVNFWKNEAENVGTEQDVAEEVALWTIPCFALVAVLHFHKTAWFHGQYSETRKAEGTFASCLVCVSGIWSGVKKVMRSTKQE